MRQADVLQASLMLRYAMKIRLVGLTEIVKTYHNRVDPRSGDFPVSHLTDLFMFEDEGQTIAYLEHCGLQISNNNQDGPVFQCISQNLRKNMPRDKNGDSIDPPTLHMRRAIESK